MTADKSARVSFPLRNKLTGLSSSRVILGIHKRDERTYELELPEFEPPAPPPEASLLNPQVAPDGRAIKSGKAPATPQAGITTALPFEFT